MKDELLGFVPEVKKDGSLLVITPESSARLTELLRRVGKGHQLNPLIEEVRGKVHPLVEGELILRSELLSEKEEGKRNSKD